MMWRKRRASSATRTKRVPWQTFADALRAKGEAPPASEKKRSAGEPGESAEDDGSIERTERGGEAQQSDKVRISEVGT